MHFRLIKRRKSFAEYIYSRSAEALVFRSLHQMKFKISLVGCIKEDSSNSGGIATPQRYFVSRWSARFVVLEPVKK